MSSIHHFPYKIESLDLRPINYKRLEQQYKPIAK
jgi:hypothetical protein